MEKTHKSGEKCQYAGNYTERNIKTGAPGPREDYWCDVGDKMPPTSEDSENEWIWVNDNEYLTKFVKHRFYPTDRVEWIRKPYQISKQKP